MILNAKEKLSRNEIRLCQNRYSLIPGILSSRPDFDVKEITSWFEALVKVCTEHETLI
jgi:hypothetical protein